MNIYEEDVDDFLEHYGVKGQKWGVRRARREAGRDAKEFARAKMFYGEGAGTRRKLIKATVEAKAKRDPTYKQHFEESLAKQDLGQHASKARGERKRKDVGKKTKQGFGAAARKATGEWGTTAAFTTLAIGGAAFLNSAKGRALMSKGSSKVKDIANSRQARKGSKLITDFMKKQGR